MKTDRRPPRSRLPRLRLHHGWSQSALAARSGVSRAEISAIETGRVVPSVAVALRLAASLGESVEAIFGTAAAGAAAPRWAWPPASNDDRRLWRASIGGALLAYPVEHTAAGPLPHDAVGDDAPVSAAAPDSSPERTLIIAGCDPLAGLLAQEMAARQGIRVIPLVRSSGDALELLRHGLVHAAGVHLSSDRTAAGNDQVVRARLGAGYALLHQVRWETGIALSSRRRERTVRDLLRAGVRWINREEGSAARGVLDRLLGTRARPSGYRHIVRDQRAVATAIASGWADAGVCIRAVSLEKQLRFVPVQQEDYELCVREALLEDPRIVALGATLRSTRYRRCLDDVPGCASAQSGEQRGVA